MSPPPPTPPPAAASYPAQPVAGQPVAAQPAPRRTSPLVWILVIILGLFVMGGIAVAGFTWFVVHKAHEAGIDPDLWKRNPGLAAAKMIAATNPNVDVVRTDDGSGTITIRDRHTGKETTLTFDQARNGRFTLHTEDDQGKRASVEFGASGKPPSWVPEYPGSNPAYNIRGSSEGGEEGGNFTFTTSDSADKVMSYYQDKIKDGGMEVKMNTTTPDGGMIVASRDGDERTLTVVVAGKPSETTVNITYARKH